MNGFLVPAICTQCSAPLRVNPEMDAAICPACGTAFVVNKAINKYNISGGNINISNSVIQMGPSAANLALRGQQFVESREFDKANEYFNKALDIDANCREALDGQRKMQFAIAQDLAANHHYKQAIEIYSRLVKQEPGNAIYHNALTAARSATLSYAYVRESVELLKGWATISGTLIVTMNEIKFFPAGYLNPSFCIPNGCFAGIGTKRSGYLESGQLNILMLYWNDKKTQKVISFRTADAYNIANRIRHYMTSGFD